ncbi:fasciclin [Nocardia mangyaensis]|uniref:Fasciclin n=1 Tax=Nocardia mangyaensis TaxID=2213200 RepID=A0A1J0VV04_9NOCA|nr:fasciclin domain-containing protein [Nocardia mangyaensis]APE35833.1 fasciclin [Nocardia mangyaensis]
MSINARLSVAGVGVAAVALFGLPACSSDDSSSDSAAMTTTPMMTTPSPSPTSEAGMMGSSLVGPGCAEYAAQVPTGPGSVEAMATEPVAVAASNNPLLTTLTAAVSGELNPEVNLVDTLNGGEFTVFAPVDEAFAELDPATVESLKTDTPTLEGILTYHVVPGRIAPDAIAGTQTTVQGGTVTVSGSGDELMVNDAAVICGGVDTANATVYLIDAVLMPQ